VKVHAARLAAEEAAVEEADAVEQAEEEEQAEAEAVEKARGDAPVEKVETEPEPAPSPQPASQVATPKLSSPASGEVGMTTTTVTFAVEEGTPRCKPNAWDENSYRSLGKTTVFRGGNLEDEVRGPA
jgi:hypothetical protein